MTSVAQRHADDRASVGIVGRGPLSQAIAAALGRAHPVTALRGDADAAAAPELDHVDLVVLVGNDADAADRALRARWNAGCLERGIALLPVQLEPGAAIVGPWIRPGEAGCLACLDARRLRARNDVVEYVKLLERSEAALAGMAAAWLTTFARDALGALVAQHLADRDEPRDPAGPRSFVRVTLDGLRTSRHRFLPDPLCARCGRLPDDTREAAAIVLAARRKVSRGSYRARSLAPEKPRLFERYVDPQAGLIRAVHKEGRIVFPSANAPMGLRATARTERGYGHQTNHEATQLTAIAEALERYGGIEPGGKRTVVRGSFRELAGDALDPTALGLHSDAQHARPGYPYPRYHAELAFNWVWGYSFARQRPILVPENYAYYGTVYRNTHDRPFVYEISNGCALGGCLEEAILHGILEVAERDAFLMTWYARLRVPRIEPRSAPHAAVPLMIDAIEHATGYAIRAYRTTLEHGVPSFWVMAVDEQARPDLPRVLCASGANLDPEKALISALFELAPLASRPVGYYRANRPRVERMLADPDQVEAMEDHALLNGAPEVQDRFDFLDPSPARLTFGDAFRDAPAPHDDLRDDVQALIQRYLATGLDVIVVDQTTPEHALGDFRCVKVIIPGMLPMTFGHAKRRITGLPRLLRVPHELGYAPRPLSEAAINPHPHPFP